MGVLTRCGIVPQDARWIPLALLSLALACSFWSTALSELACGLFLISTITLLTFRSGLQSSGPLLVQSRAIRPVMLFALVYVAGFTLSLLLSPVSRAIPLHAHRIWHILLLPTIVALKLTESEIRTIARSFAFSGAVAAASAIVFFIVTGAERLQSLFVGDTTFVDLLTLAGIIIVAATLEDSLPTAADRPTRRRQQRWVLAFPGITVALAIFLSAHKAPTFAFIAAVLMLCAATRPRLVPFVAATLSALLLLAPRSFWLGMRWMAGGNRIDRYTLWEAGIRLVRSIPLFGYGPGSFEQVLPDSARAAFMNRAPSSWHNDLLQILLENGWLTCAAYAGLIISLALLLRRTYRSAGRTDSRMMLMTLIILLAVFAGFMAVGSVVSTAVLGLAFWTLAGIIAVVASKGYTHAASR